jgi:protein-tyrosine phosphatase
MLFWIPHEDAPGRLAVVPRPRGNDWLAADVAGWRRAGVSVVVSLLTPDEETELGLGDEAAECAAVGVQFVRLPVPDRGVPPNRAEFERVVSDVAAEVSRGGMVAMHCRQSVGRAPLLAVAVLKAFGVTSAEAIARVSAARGVQVPETKEQAEWVAGLG